MSTQEPDPVLCITLDVRPALNVLILAAGVAWVSSKHQKAFMAHDWPIHDELSGMMMKRSYALISPDDPASAKIPHKALLSGRPVRPATLHEALALAAHRHELEWWSHDFAAVGTRVNGHSPTVATRGDAIYLGTEWLSPHDLPSFFLISF